MAELEPTADKLPDWQKIIHLLTPAQRRAYDRICCGDDSRIARQTGEALVRKGLVRSFVETIGRDGFGAIKVYRYDFNIAPHIVWCEMMSREYEEGKCHE